MTVRQMLASLSSREIAEWQAYKRARGPLGRSHSEEKLAEIHETLQLLIKVHAPDFEVQPSTRPHEAWDHEQDGGDD